MSHPISKTEFTNNGAGRCWHCGRSRNRHILLDRLARAANGTPSGRAIGDALWCAAEAERRRREGLKPLPSLLAALRSDIECYKRQRALGR